MDRIDTSYSDWFRRIMRYCKGADTNPEDYNFNWHAAWVAGQGPLEAFQNAKGAPGYDVPDDDREAKE